MELITHKVKEHAEYDGHAFVYHLHDDDIGFDAYIAIHRQEEMQPALGGTRFWDYDSPDDAIEDVLRLSRLMTFKSLAAGLPYTGAKGVIMLPKNKTFNREKLFAQYASWVEKLTGKFVTGTDVGVTNDDLTCMESHTSHVIGHGVDSGYFTAIGLFFAIQKCLGERYGSEVIAGRSFSIQGLGKTGFPLVSFLYNAGARLYVSDIDEKKVSIVQSLYRDVTVVSAADIHKISVDVFCPCALSGVINFSSLEEFDCQIIVGAANNQLADNILSEQLHDRGILYEPDFLVNSGGMISVVDQFLHGVADERRILTRVARVPSVLSQVFSLTRTKDISVSSALMEVLSSLV